MSLQNKTEPASGRRRQDVRNEGRVCKSQDLNSAAVLLVGLLVIKIAGPYMMTTLTEMLRDTFSNLHNREVTFESLKPMALNCTSKFLLLSLPILLASAAAGVLSNVLQFGFKFTPKTLQPNFNKLNPLPGIANMFSAKTLVEVVKGIAKLVVVGYVLYSRLRGQFPLMTDLAEMPATTAISVVGTIIWKLFIAMWFSLLVIAIIDYAYQYFSFENSIKMTKQEVKDEYKKQEGDPAIKGKIRQRQREISRRRMVQSVPKADVVIVNPIHFAVAVKYDPKTMAAPVVVAKGQRLLAEKIKSVALANNVPIVENIPVARTLYKMVEVDGPIPENLYQAVAEILAYVYRLSEKAGRRMAS